MNRNFFGLLFAFFAAMQANAQITISASDYPIDNGITYTVKKGFVNVSPGEEGPNKYWDFSSLADNSTDGFAFGDCSNTTYCDTFPGANFFIATASSPDTSFYVKDTSGIYLKGSGSAILRSYTGRRELMFPMQYHASFQNQYSCLVTVAVTYHFPENGSIEATVDGYGTVVTPIGAYYNVLRVKKIIEFEGFDGFRSRTESYSWYQPGMGYPILQVSKVKGTDRHGTTTYSYPYQYTTNPLNSVGIKSVSEPVAFPVAVFPNPAGSAFKVSTGQLKNCTISVKNVLGAAVFQSSTGLNASETTIQANHWARGVYFVEITAGDGSHVSKKIVLQ